MSMHKVGIANKIKTVAASEQDFEKMKSDIINTNSLVRCVRCGKLLAKVSSDQVSVKRKDVDLVAKVQDMSVKCPVCGTCNKVVFG